MFLYFLKEKSFELYDLTGSSDAELTNERFHAYRNALLNNNNLILAASSAEEHLPYESFKAKRGRRMIFFIDFFLFQNFYQIIFLKNAYGRFAVGRLRKQKRRHTIQISKFRIK